MVPLNKTFVERIQECGCIVNDKSTSRMETYSLLGRYSEIFSVTNCSAAGVRKINLPSFRKVICGFSPSKILLVSLLVEKI